MEEEPTKFCSYNFKFAKCRIKISLDLLDPVAKMLTADQMSPKFLPFLNQK